MNGIRPFCRGFTLIELLVVIGIVSILTAFLLPAIQVARESARQTSCKNKQRQLGLACLNYEAARGYFPVGYHKSPGPMQYSNWILSITPYIERQTIYDRAQVDYLAYPNPFLNLSSHSGFKTTLPELICPSYPNALTPSVTEYGEAGNTTYLGVLGKDYKSLDGLFGVDRGRRAGQVLDGLSNTLLLGERPPSKDNYYGWWYAGVGQEMTSSLDSLLGVRELNQGLRGNAACPPGPFRFGPGDPDSQCSCLHFWSTHPGGAVFTLADGSTRFFPYDTDAVMPQLATISGKEFFDLP